MFGGLFKTKGQGYKAMKELLVRVQSKLSADQLGQELRFYQHGFIYNLVSFNRCADSFKDEGMSELGGLAKFCNNALVQTLTPLDNGDNPMPLVVDLADKLAHVVQALPEFVDETSTPQDREALVEAEISASRWMAHQARNTLLDHVEDKLHYIQTTFGKAGVFQHKQEVMELMKAW